MILAPTTMMTQQGKRIKTDKRDALMIAQCLAYGGYHAVHIPTDKDDDIKAYLRMRDDHKSDLKKTKQRINAFCLSQGFYYEKGKWTQAHLKWLKTIGLGEMDRETLNEYLITYEYLTDRIEAFDKWIEELASDTEYVEKVKKLVCFLGIKTHTALSCLVETGDFQRFAKGNIYSAYLGLVPGEDSSSDNINRLSITKAGNSHLRKLLVEASRGICKGVVGHKSKDLKARQSGNSPEVIAYADRANERLRRKYYKMIRHICMFKLNAENKDAKIAEFFERAESLKEIPQLKRFEVVKNDKRTPDSNYDVSLIFDFDSVEDLNTYQTSPIHLKFGEFVASVKEARACIDYEF